MKTDLSPKAEIAILLLLFSVLMSLPFLVAHCGALALVAFVPLLFAEQLAREEGIKGFFWWYYAAFVVFNALTTWWVCEATVGGGIFAVLANSLFMSLIFGVFRLSRKRLGGCLPYILLASLWIAWERFYLVHAQISWPWLCLGNAFARSTRLIQWYEWTGMLGGSLWVWIVNLAIFGILQSVRSGSWHRFNSKAKLAAAAGLTLALAGPIVCSEILYDTYRERDDRGKLSVVIAQSNFDPWHKLRAVPQWEQNKQVVDLFEGALTPKDSLSSYPSAMTLMVLPETFTSDIWMNDVTASPTWKTFSRLTDEFSDVNLLFGASTHERFTTAAPPSRLARQLRDGSWYLSYNTAFMTDSTGRVEWTNKTKLVVGSELTPYPAVFAPLDDALSKALGVEGGLMGRCVPQGYARNLTAVDYAPDGSVRRRVSIGVPICYESIYPEFCREYVQNGAVLLSVITNDGWWGNTPGYRQHFSYSRLRAIELRRDIARCANTGISAFINQRGDVLQQSSWWTPDLLRGEVNLTSRQTFFAKNGDIVGRLCTFVAVLMLLTFFVRLFVRKK